MKRLLIIQFAALLCSCTNGPITSNDPQISAKNDSLATARVRLMLDSMKLSKIKIGIDDMDAFSPQKYEGETASIITACKMVEDHASECRGIPDSASQEIKKSAKILEAKIKQVRLKHWPTMRKLWASAANEKLWENNITVKCFGKGNTSLELVGGIFASNKNIKDTQESISEGLNVLRFKRVNYRWYKGADEYQYYTIDSPPDSEL